MTAPVACQDMNDLTGWQRVPCSVADLLLASAALVVFAGSTDERGADGPAFVYREWGLVENETPILREYRWPKDDARTCEHYVPVVS